MFAPCFRLEDCPSGLFDRFLENRSKAEPLELGVDGTQEKLMGVGCVGQLLSGKADGTYPYS